MIMLTAIQAFSAVCGSILVREITRRYGPRRMMLTGYPLVWLKGAGHNSNTDAADLVNQLIEEFARNLV